MQEMYKALITGMISNVRNSMTALKVKEKQLGLPRPAKIHHLGLNRADLRAIQLYGGGLGELGLFSLEGGGLGGDLIAVCRCMEECHMGGWWRAVLPGSGG